jgi:hypothetical protein
MPKYRGKGKPYIVESEDYFYEVYKSYDVCYYHNEYTLEEKENFLKVFINYIALVDNNSTFKSAYEDFLEYFHKFHKEDIDSKTIITPSLSTVKKFIAESLKEHDIVDEQSNISVSVNICKELCPYYSDFSKVDILPVESYRIYIMKLPKDCDISAIKNKFQSKLHKTLLSFIEVDDTTSILFIRTDTKNGKAISKTISKYCTELN